MDSLKWDLVPLCDGLSRWTHNTGFVSTIPLCVTKAPLVTKATGNHSIKSSSLEKTQCPVSGCYYARNRVCDTASPLKLRYG